MKARTYLEDKFKKLYGIKKDPPEKHTDTLDEKKFRKEIIHHVDSLMELMVTMDDETDEKVLDYIEWDDEELEKINAIIVEFDSVRSPNKYPNDKNDMSFE